MALGKHINKIIIAVMAATVVLCLLAIAYSDKLMELYGGTGVTMEYETKLFDTNEPMSIDVQMDEDTWNQMLVNAISEEYYVCDVVINGQKINNVAIRPKGNTSLSAIAMDPDSDRYSLKLEFDHFVDGQTCYGLDKLILNNNYADATNMKEAIIYDMYQYIGAEASLYNYAKVSVNGEYWGVYLALEGVEQSFMLRNFGTQDGELYKPDSMEMGGGDSSSSSSSSSSASFPARPFGESSRPEMPNMPQKPSGQETTDGATDTPAGADTSSGQEMPAGVTETPEGLPEKSDGVSETPDGTQETPSGQQMPDGMEKPDEATNIPGGAEASSGTNETVTPPDTEGMDFTNFDPSQFEGKTPPSGGMPSEAAGEQPTVDAGKSAQSESDGGSTQNGESDKSGRRDRGDFKPSGNGNGGDQSSSGGNGNDSDRPSGGGKGKGGNRPSGGGMGGFSVGKGGANLNYSDDDLDSYSTIWEGEITGTGDADHRRVVTALKNISEGTDLEKYLDVDNILKYMAVHEFAVNMDSLSGSMAHNYYLYEYKGQLNLFPWDYNLSFGGMSMGRDGDATEVVNDAIDTPFSGTKFFDALLENEEYKARYHDYLQLLADEYVNGGRFDETYERIRSQIDSLVETDPTAFYSYEEYQTAAGLLYETVKLRAESIEGQLSGTIPSTDDGQRQNSEALVDASHIDIKAMGQFNMGGFGGDSKSDDSGESKDDSGGDTKGDAGGDSRSDADSNSKGDNSDSSENAEQEDKSDMSSFKPGNVPGMGDFDPENMPDMGDFDPENMPNMGDFNPNNMPDMSSFNPSSMPGTGSFNPGSMSGGSLNQSERKKLLSYGAYLLGMVAVLFIVSRIKRRK